MLNQDKIRLQELSHKSLMGTITDAEKKELNDWLNQVEEKPLEIPGEIAKNKERYGEYLFQQISEQTGIKPETQTTKLWPRIAIAAAIAFIVIGAYLFRSTFTKTDNDTNALVAADIAPGKNGATLTLANGTKIFINDALAGNIANQSGVKITKTKDGQIIYEITDQGTTKIEYNTLTTTRGEQTQVRLPDGSLVFLNAASSLKYPTSFAKSAKRSVGLTGEGYFEIAKNKSHPFIVETEKQRVEVLGTHFNINAYKDEKAVRTTLLEGSVKVAPLTNNKTKSSILKPGQQSVFDENGIQVTEVDMEEAMAWQKGYFSFYDEDISTVMRKVSRWYDIEVEYQGQLPEVGFNARIDKYSNIKDVLRILEKSKAVHFKIEGRKVIVSK